jgi:hypothetical protein
MTRRLGTAAHLLLSCVFVAPLVIASEAKADVSVDQCVDANTQAQSLRRSGKLAAARTQLRACADPACPAMVRDDCTQRLDELERAQPSLVFDVKDGNGGDLVDVKVTLDGQPLAEHLGGTALPIDPGVHEFTFAVEGQTPVTQKLIVKEGEKGRHESVVIGVRTATPASTLDTTAPPAEPAKGLGTQKFVGIAVGAAGVVALGIGTIFGLVASSAWNSAKSACGGDPTHCVNPSGAASYHDTSVTDGTISTVGFVAGGALVAAGAVLFLTGGPARDRAAKIWIGPMTARQAGGLSLGGVL